MTPPSYSWVVFTLIAAGAQMLRNASQHDLTARIGAAGATFVRFLFAFPFALAFLALACIASGARPPEPDAEAIGHVAIASGAQVAGTALMLLAMRERSFVVATALIKTEAVQIVLFSVLFLGEPAPPSVLLAVSLATVGVFALFTPTLKRLANRDPSSDLRSAFYGLASAAGFAVATIGFRAGVVALRGESIIVAASEVLAIALALQTFSILFWLAVFDRPVLNAIAREWRSSLAAGLLGAFATQFWFQAFALETAARVRTLGLVEVLFAQLATHRLFAQRTTPREAAGVALILVGVILALNGR
jgi:drug/metabolite transporter (DMT)-like permease